MRIVYLHQYFNIPSMTGGIRSYEMARRLVDAGHEVHMVTTDRSVDSSVAGWRDEVIDGIHIYWYATPYSNAFGFTKRVLAFLRFALAARSKAAELQGDIVFATSTPLTIAIPGVYASRKCAIPLVFEVRDLWPELPIAIGAIRNPVLKWLSRRLEKYAYVNSSRIIALSPGMADGIEAAGFPRSKITIVPNNCSTERFQSGMADKELVLARIPELQGRKIVLYAGTFGLINGVTYLVDIAEKARAIDPAIAFLLIGDGLEKEQIVTRARSKDLLGTQVWIEASVAKDEIPAYFNAATVTCSIFIDLPEMSSNSANKFFDSLAAGRPVAINYQGWQAELLEQTGAGICMPASDATMAAQMLCEFVADDGRREAAAAAAAELAATTFSTDHVFEDFLATIESAYTEG